MKRIISYLSNYKRQTILAPAFKMLEATFELFVPLVVARIIDQGIGMGDKGCIISSVFLMLVLALIGLICAVSAQYFAACAAVGSATALRKDLFAHIQSLDYARLDDVGTSTLITRMTSDINQVQNGINMILRLFLRSPFIVFGAMIMAFTIDVEAALIFVVTIPLLSIVVFGIMYLSSPVYRRVQEGLDRILLITRENLTGVRVIRAFNREEGEKKRFYEANEALTMLQKTAGRLSGLTNPVTYIIINVAIVVLIYSGAIRVSDGTLSQGQVVALYNYMSQILVELIKLANLIVTLSKAYACVGRIDGLFQITTGMVYGQAQYECAKSHKVDGQGNDQQKADSKKAEVVYEISKLSFAYEHAGQEALSDISFTVYTGQTIGIIGGTGSGKSTLVNLLSRFYDRTEGTIRLFGRPIEEYTQDSLRDMIAITPQKAQLFKGSIRDNLRLGREDASEEEIIRALKIAQAYDFVMDKENGLDYMIEQSGRNLSGGQKQRLTIARALVSDAPVLILDDSASALDYATDARLREAIHSQCQDKTVFIVAQRASSVMQADKILVMEDGQAVGFDTHEKLLAGCAVYREIYESQFGKGEEQV